MVGSLAMLHIQACLNDIDEFIQSEASRSEKKSECTESTRGSENENDDLESQASGVSEDLPMKILSLDSELQTCGASEDLPVKFVSLDHELRNGEASDYLPEMLPALEAPPGLSAPPGLPRELHAKERDACALKRFCAFCGTVR